MGRREACRAGEIFFLYGVSRFQAADEACTPEPKDRGRARIRGPGRQRRHVAIRHRLAGPGCGGNDSDGGYDASMEAQHGFSGAAWVEYDANLRRGTSRVGQVVALPAAAVCAADGLGSPDGPCAHGRRARHRAGYPAAQAIAGGFAAPLDTMVQSASCIIINGSGSERPRGMRLCGLPSVSNKSVARAQAPGAYISPRLRRGGPAGT